MEEKLWTREDELELEVLAQLGLQTGQVDECHSVYLSPTSCDSNKMRTCMIGAAMVGKFGDKELAYQRYRAGMSEMTGAEKFTEEGYIKMFSSILGINKHLLLRASYKHMGGVKIADQIEMLKTNCYN